jgi:tRNA (guanine37-N1)-methyltransferase
MSYDIIGNIAIVIFPVKTKLAKKKQYAKKLLKKHKSLTTVVEKLDKIKGRLRTIKTRHLQGIKTLETLHNENSCSFRLNIETCYFSPRLSTQRKEIAKKIKKDESVLVMFGGVAPFPIVISKFSKAKNITSIELGKACNTYAIENIKRNKTKNIELIQGDVRKKTIGKFDRIIMPRPNLKDSFLNIAFKSIKKGGSIHYYGFYNKKDKNNLTELINSEAKKAKKKVKIIKITEAGEIAPYKFRYRVDFKVF